MGEMITRVATAIAECSMDGPFEDWSERMALAAIAAMREPTDAMVEAGIGENQCDLPGGTHVTMAVEPAYCAMIDAAVDNIAGRRG